MAKIDTIITWGGISLIILSMVFFSFYYYFTEVNSCTSDPLLYKYGENYSDEIELLLESPKIAICGYSGPTAFFPDKCIQIKGEGLTFRQ